MKVGVGAPYAIVMNVGKHLIGRVKQGFDRGQAHPEKS